jgi:hypothetical protein
MYKTKYYDSSGFMFSTKLCNNHKKAQHELKRIASKLEKLGGYATIEKCYSPFHYSIEKEVANA